MKRLIDFQRIYAIVRRIPKGRVATYGQVARLAGAPRHARHVGYAMSVCPRDVPWQRVVNALGRISSRGSPVEAARQRRRLLAEGVQVDEGGRLRLTTYQWDPHIKGER